jgi:hypothetical protein
MQEIGGEAHKNVTRCVDSVRSGGLDDLDDVGPLTAAAQPTARKRALKSVPRALATLRSATRVPDPVMLIRSWTVSMPMVRTPKGARAGGSSPRPPAERKP